MDVFIKSSQSSDISEAVKEVTDGLESPKLLFFFAPTTTFKEISESFNNKYPKCQIIGVSSHCVYKNDKVFINSLSVTAFLDDIDVSAGFIPEITRYPLKYSPDIEISLRKIPDYDKSNENIICLEYTTAYSYSEELVLQTLDTICSKYSIPIAGGTAGTNKTKKDFISYIYFQGQIYQEGCVYLFIKNNHGKIKIYKENIYKPTEKEFIATSVNVTKRVVKEFDNTPAADVIMRALECDAQSLPEQLIEHPLGRYSDGEYYISAFGRIFEDNSLSWAARIYNNTKVSLLRLGDYKSTVAKTVETIKKEFSSPSLLFLIQCEIRVNIFEKENYLDTFGKEYGSNFPLVSGFSSHGEQINKMHLNQYLLVIVFE